jgi:lipopolysaccharide export system protein LptA
MKRFAVITALAATLATTLAVGGAVSQISGGGGPIDVTADELEMLDSQKMAIWRGNVEAIQGENRMLANELQVHFSGRSGSAPSADQGPGKNWGDVQKLVADGRVFFISPLQTARGNHAVYEMVPDTITMTGDVVVVQGENVVKGDKLVIQVKSGHATVVSNEKGRNKPERVRGVFYSEPGAPAASPAPAAPAAPATTAP